MVREQGVGGQGVKALGGNGVKDSTGADRAGEAGVPAGYKRTEVGVVPVEWEVVELGTLGSFGKGRGIRKSEVQSTGIPCIRYGELYTKHHNIVRNFYSYIDTTTALTAQELVCGDVLFAASGETKAEIGKSVAYNSSTTAYIGSDIIVFRPREGVDSSYLGYALNSDPVTSQKAARGQGDAVVHISTNAVKSLVFPLPPLPEQQAIAGALGEADALLAALDGLIAKKAAVKQATLEELLSGRRRLGGYEGEWETVSIDEVATVDEFSLPATTSPDYEFSYISLESVSLGNIKFTTKVKFGDSPSRARRIVDTGCILFATVRPLLMSHAHISGDTNDLIASTGFAVIRCGPNLTSSYAYYAMIAPSIMGQVEGLLVGSNYPAINSSDVKQLSIRVPILSEQRAIATLLTTLDDELTALRARREKLAAVKAGMMEQLLTGAVRLV